MKAPDLPPPPPIDPIYKEFFQSAVEDRNRLIEEAQDAKTKEEWAKKGKPKSGAVLRRRTDGRKNVRSIFTIADDIARAEVDPYARVPFGSKLTYYPNYVRVNSPIPKWMGGKSSLMPVLNVDFIKSAEKGSGQAYKAFQKLINISEKTGRPIYSDTLLPQYSPLRSEIRPSLNKLADVAQEMSPNASTFDVLKKNYPQLRYRETPNLKTSGKFWAQIYPEMDLDLSKQMATIDSGQGPYKIERSFKSLSDLRRQINQIPKGSLYNPNTSFEFYSLTSRVPHNYGRDLMPAARTLGRALGTEAASLGGMALRGAGRLAGPVGVAMTAYDLAQAFPAPAPISEEEMGKALRSYRTGPQPSY